MPGAIGLWISRRPDAVHTDYGGTVRSQDAGMSYAILWREDGGHVRVGKLVVHDGGLVLEGGDGRGDVRRELAHSSIRSVRIDRTRHERLNGRPVAVLEADTKTFTIASLAGRGELNELVARVDGSRRGGGYPHA